MAGGIDWFRWHHGSVTDPKFGLIAKKAGVRVGDVIAVWAMVLESASGNEDRGVMGQVDAEAIEFLLGMEDGMTYKILDAMTQRGLIGVGGRVESWEKRQPKRERDTDNSADRTRAYRERQKQQGDAEQSHVTPHDASEHQKNARGEKSREEEKREEESLSGKTVGAAGAAATKPEAKATRIAADWQLPKAWGEWALAEYPHWTPDVVRLEGQKFADHWRAQPGKDGRKTDWPATWRNWCRNDICQKSHPVQGAAKPSKRNPMTDEDRAAWIAAEGEKAERLLFGGGPSNGDVIDLEPIGVSHAAI